MNFLEIIGFISGIVGVWLTTRQIVWCFPIGIVNVIISLLLFYEQKLYSDSIQQVFYFILLTYGWMNWSQKKQSFSLTVTRMDSKQYLISVGFVLITTFILGYTFANNTDADVPYIDAAATAMSFLAQYLIAKKKIENWVIWIAVNIMYIGIYLYKDLYLYAVLFSVYLALAISGYIAWKKSLSVLSSGNE